MSILLIWSFLQFTGFMIMVLPSSLSNPLRFLINRQPSFQPVELKFLSNWIELDWHSKTQDSRPAALPNNLHSCFSPDFTSKIFAKKQLCCTTGCCAIFRKWRQYWDVSSLSCNSHRHKLKKGLKIHPKKNQPKESEDRMEMWVWWGRSSFDPVAVAVVPLLEALNSGSTVAVALVAVVPLVTTPDCPIRTPLSHTIWSMYKKKLWIC